MTENDEKCIVVVDDDAHYRSMAKFYLDASGYRVFLSGNWKEAKLLIDYLTPRLLIVDGLLPGRSGVEIAKEVRKDFSNETLPILLITSFFRDERSKQDAMREGQIDGFLRKPIENIQLFDCVNKLIGQGQTAGVGRTVTTPNMYENSRQDYLKILSSYDGIARKVIRGSDADKPPTMEQWMNFFNGFFSLYGESYDDRADVDKDYCLQALARLTSKTLRTQGTSNGR